MSITPRFKTSVLAVAIAALPLFAESAGLGRLDVLSGLGQPFRGEIELVSVQPGEVDALRATLANPEAYASAQLAYPSPSLGLRMALNKRGDGKMVVQISSAGAIDEPVFNLLVDLGWPGGQVRREYTALIDPVGYSAAPGGAKVTSLAGNGYASSVLPGTRVSSAIRTPKATSRSVRSGKGASVPVDQGTEAGEGYTVKAGDTLARVAAQVKPEGVSLEQALVGLYQANPRAFDGNMNRLKRGKILRIPSAEELAKVEKPEAVKEIRAQAADWQNYRRQLAGSAAKAPAVDSSGSVAGGRITAKVEDKGAQAADKSKDVLKLSRGASQVDGQQARMRALEEEAVARKKSLDEANQRVAVLEKNIQKMEELAALKSKSGAELQRKAEQVKVPAPAASVAAEVLPIATASAVAASTVSEAAAPASVVASAVPVKPKPKRVVPPQPAPTEPGVIDAVMENALPIGGGLLAILLGVGGLLWSRKRNRSGIFENSLITSGDLKPNTVLGRTGGGVISTQAENSFLTDFSRQGLGTIDTDEVDPIAEADVYMAYGRDVQAEEILRDALAKDSTRHEIRMKLLDIYAARKDKTAFEEVAADLYASVGGKGPLWEQAAYLGRGIDPDNPLYAAPAGTVVSAVADVAAATAAAAAGSAASVADAPVAEAQVVAARIDNEAPLDFEFEVPHVEQESGSALEAVLDDTHAENDFSFDLGFDHEAELTAPTEAEMPTMEPVIPAEIELPASAEIPETEPVLDLSSFVVPETTAPEDELMALDLPIDLDMEAAESRALAPGEASSFVAPTLDMPELDLDLALNVPDAEPGEDASEAQLLAEFDAGLGSSEESLRFDMPAEEVHVGAVEDENIDLDFDFSADLGEPSASRIAVAETPLDLDLEIGGGAGANETFTLEDPVQTKIELARAYLGMGDVEGAREILQEAEQEGNPGQQEVIRSLLADL